MRDIYDEEIARLTANPDDIEESWNHYHPLFELIDARGICCCPTQFKGCKEIYGGKVDPLVAKKIFEDERIPTNVKYITVESLPAFAEVQRLADNIYGKIPGNQVISRDHDDDDYYD